MVSEFGLRAGTLLVSTVGKDRPRSGQEKIPKSKFLERYAAGKKRKFRNVSNTC